METKNEHVGNLRSGSYILFDGIPCIVKDIQTSRTGKHGHAKCRIEAIGMFEDKKIIRVMPAHDNIEVPIVEKRSAQVLSVTGAKANIMDLETYETFDVDIPKELKDKLSEGGEVVYWAVMGKKVLKQAK
ncbi:MAG: translation initiation factor IF-5A [Nanoarchaeota archaeon]|nr:translation initiation factor IF-5A [Nanoarchaeota archaeon]